jgi:hypothetical protein
MTLAERASRVRTRDDLAAFIAELKADLDANPEEWANADLGSFLEAMAAWMLDMEGYYENTGQVLRDLPAWKILADALMAARVYE